MDGGVVWLMSGPRNRSPMSERECAVLLLAAAGCTNKAIAVQLGITDATIKFHFAKIFRKLQVTSRTEAVSVAAACGWIRLPPGSDSVREDDSP
jgi:DNA-binding NarL/FixJ family response regulator